MNVCIVIPTYREDLDTYEIIGLKRCAEVLCNIPVAVVCPQGFNAHQYQQIFGERLLVIPFDAFYFKNLQRYNRLLTSLRFYKAFENWDYILIHHTDAYVFRNELEYWCNKGYDYIGAPIYEFNGTIRPEKYIGVGNGGFSLHRVVSAIKVLNSWKLVYPVRELLAWYLKYNWKGRLRYSAYFASRLLGYGRLSHSGFNHLRINEDIFWGVYVPRAFKWFKVAPFDDAYKFSMEYNCEKLFELNNQQLPFGCHQWFKGDFLQFWKPHIEALTKS
jgi:hypothetical protein